MSSAHIQLRKVTESDREVTYDVLSPDFNPAQEWEVVAQIALRKHPFEYDFFPRNVWLGQKIVPPYVYELGQDDLERMLVEKFTNHGYGAWTGRIASQLRRMREQHEFPEVAP